MSLIDTAIQLLCAKAAEHERERTLAAVERWITGDGWSFYDISPEAAEVKKAILSKLRDEERGVFGRTERLNSGPTSQRIWDEAHRRPW